MGISDRDYARPAKGERTSLLRRTASSPVVRALVIFNVVIFLFSPGLFPSTDFTSASWRFFAWGALQPLQIIEQQQWWRLLSSVFLHGHFFHILFNMFVLSQFGPQLERALGSLRFLIFYLLCGLAGSITYISFAYLVESELKLSIGVGASGAIYGVLFSLAVIAPHQRIMLLIPPIPLKLRTFAFVMAAFGVVIIGSRGNNYGGELAHLGGAILGALLAWRPQLLGLTAASPIAVGKASEHRGRSIQEAQILDETQLRKQAEIDEILDKVSAQGIHSLTEEERKTLEAFRQELKR